MSNLPVRENSRIPISLKALPKQKDKRDNVNEMKENDDNLTNTKLTMNKGEGQSARLTKLSDIIDGNKTNRKDITVKRHSQHFTSNTLKLSDLSVNQKHNSTNKSKPSNLPILIK